MRWSEINEARSKYSAEEAKEIGDRAIIAMSLVTGLPWDTVFEQAQSEFGKYGMNSGTIGRTMRALGWVFGPKYQHVIFLPSK
jgi:hypothetical protein